MIDVVFLLLVFFMLVSRFEQPVFIDLEAASSGASQVDAPRLVEIEPSTLRLNGFVVDETSLTDRLEAILQERDGLVVLRPTNGANFQRLLDIAEVLKLGGFTSLAVIE